jgi:hypothetical protein
LHENKRHFANDLCGSDVTIRNARAKPDSAIFFYAKRKKLRKKSSFDLGMFAQSRNFGILSATPCIKMMALEMSPRLLLCRVGFNPRELCKPMGSVGNTNPKRKRGSQPVTSLAHQVSAKISFLAAGSRVRVG